MEWLSTSWDQRWALRAARLFVLQPGRVVRVWNEEHLYLSSEEMQGEIVHYTPLPF